MELFSFSSIRRLYSFQLGYCSSSCVLFAYTCPVCLPSNMQMRFSLCKWRIHYARVMVPDSLPFLSVIYDWFYWRQWNGPFTSHPHRDRCGIVAGSFIFWVECAVAIVTDERPVWTQFMQIEFSLCKWDGFGAVANETDAGNLIIPFQLVDSPFNRR